MGLGGKVKRAKKGGGFITKILRAGMESRVSLREE